MVVHVDPLEAGEFRMAQKSLQMVHHLNLAILECGQGQRRIVCYQTHLMSRQRGITVVDGARTGMPRMGERPSRIDGRFSGRAA